MKWLVLAATALFSSASIGAELYVGMTTWHPTKTAEERENINENNELFILSHNGWVAGTMINSYNQRTYLVGKTWKIESVGLFAEAGAAITYGYCWEAMEYGRQFNVDTCEQSFIPAPIISFGYESGPIAFKVIAGGTAINSGIQISF